MNFPKTQQNDEASIEPRVWQSHSSLKQGNGVVTLIRWIRKLTAQRNILKIVN